jgi:6-phosphogluconolactonase/glucosamine-6-phosphate isomerase/deaminase
MNGSLDRRRRRAGEFAERVIEAFHGRPNDGFSIALSGGAPRGRATSGLADDAGTQIDWWKVDVYWGDERCVPLDDPRHRTTHLAREAPVSIAWARQPTFRMRCEEGADPYHAAHRRARPFDLIHLGLGPTAITASLFPGSARHVEADPGRLVVSTTTRSGHIPHPRHDPQPSPASAGPAWWSVTVSRRRQARGTRPGRGRRRRAGRPDQRR